MKSGTGNYIAFFDLDRTILNVNSGTSLVFEAHRRKLITTTGLLKAVYYSLLYRFNMMETDRIIAGMGIWLKGIPVSDLENLAEFVVKKYLVGSIRPEIYSEIQTHKANNAELVILSSAIREICIPIQEILGFDFLICTKMETENGFYTGIPINNFCFEEEKRQRLLIYCNSANYKPIDAFYYGDSIADLPALEAVGRPVCISPDKKLKKIAKERGWEIKNW